VQIIIGFHTVASLLDKDWIFRYQMSDQEAEMDEMDTSVITPSTTSSGTKKKGKDGKDKASIKGSGADQIQLPIARVKKIIKADKDVKYLSSDASILLAKATVSVVTRMELERMDC
jgi:hypothetical protein